MKAPVFSIDFRKGSNISDQCGIGTPTTNVGFLKNTYGYACFNRGITFPLFDIDLSEDFTEVFAFYFYEEGDLYSDSIIKIEGNECNPYLRINTIKTNRTLVLTYKLSTGAAFNVISIPIIKNKTYFVAFTHNKASRTFNLYINNILYSYIYPSNHNFNKLNSTPIVRPSSSNKIGFYFMKVYDYILNKNDIDKLYKEFIYSKPTFKPINNFNYPKPTIVNEEGLVAAYNFIPSRNKMLNISTLNPANNNNPASMDLTLIKTQINKDGLYFSRKAYSYCSFNKIQNSPNITISFIAKHNSAGNANIMSMGGNSGYRIQISNNNNLNLIDRGSSPTSNVLRYMNFNKNVIYVVTACFYDSGLIIYINGKKRAFNNTPFGGYFTTSSYVIGAYSSTIEPLIGTIYDYRHYNRKLTENEIIDYNNKFASQLVLFEDFSNYSINSKTKHMLNSGWVVTELSYNNDFLKKGDKYLTSVGSGRWFGISNKNRYGTFEFDILINTYSSSNMIYFISSSYKATALGYAIGFDISDPSKINIKRGGTIILSTNYSLQLNVFYHIKVEADINNRFKLYVNNIYLGTSTVDNTYLTTNIFKFTSASIGGMYVSNIKIKQGIVIQ